jgi:hypothetical protein
MPNFSDAAARHWTDGEHLLQTKRLDNADQLFGVAAECALKVAILSQHKLDPEAEPPSGYLCHVNDLWNKLPIQALSKRYPALPVLLKKPNPFQDWNVAQRYSVTGAVSLETIEAHREATKRLLGAIQVLGTRGQ